MKVHLRLLAASVLFGAILSVGHAFEGRVSLLMTVERGRTMTIAYAFKGQKVRTELSAEGHSTASITDLQKNETLLLLAEQRMYMVTPPFQNVDTTPGASIKPDVKTTGKTDTILGHACNQILVKEKMNVTELWVTEDIGAYVGMGQGGIPIGAGFSSTVGPVQWEEVLKDQGAFPLRVISRDPAGKQTVKLEVTKIQPGPLPDSLFAPPAGYQKSNFPERGKTPKAGE
jgi:hypothetical protein